MYWNISRFIKLITYILRNLQSLLFLYFILYIVYWFCAVTKLTISHYLAPFFVLPQDIVMSIFKFFKWYINSDFDIFQPEIFISMTATFIFLVLSNFVFIVTGKIEEFFVEKAYEKGEKDYE